MLLGIGFVVFGPSGTRVLGFGLFWNAGVWFGGEKFVVVGPSGTRVCFGVLLGQGFVVLAISRIINAFSQAFQKHR